MFKPDLIVYVPDFGRIPEGLHDEARRMETMLTDHEGDARYKPRERMGHEKKVEPSCAEPLHPDDPTHQRLGAWLISDSIEAYGTDEPRYYADSFRGIYVFKFYYDPLPDNENPWVAIPRR